jgi:hypothetical protein
MMRRVKDDSIIGQINTTVVAVNCCGVGLGYANDDNR